MAGSCPTPGPEDPLVRSLLGVVDCNVEGMVHSGYSALFADGSPLTGVLTALMTLYVAFIGFSLMFGRTQLRVGDLVLTTVKLVAVLALATQWDVYQAFVYRFLFDGPTQLADGVLNSMRSGRVVASGDVFDALQAAFDQLTASAAAYAKHAPGTVSPAIGGPASGAALLTASAGLLVFSSLGVLLAAKLVLALLLAVGPVFIALLLFDSTRGLFEGWVRAAVLFALAPLASILLLGVGLTLLAGPLDQLAALTDSTANYPLGPVYAVFTLVLVIAGVSLGLAIAGGVIARGFKLPERRAAPARERDGITIIQPEQVSWMQPRAARIAQAAASLERREAVGSLSYTGAAGSAGSPGDHDRRTDLLVSPSAAQRGGRETVVLPPEPRLGQGARRSAGPRAVRGGRA